MPEAGDPRPDHRGDHGVKNSRGRIDLASTLPATLGVDTRWPPPSAMWAARRG
jgi:hypothetical protein